MVHLVVAAQEAEVRGQLVSLRALAEPRHAGRGLQRLAVHEPVDERVDGGVRVAQEEAEREEALDEGRVGRRVHRIHPGTERENVSFINLVLTCPDKHI